MHAQIAAHMTRRTQAVAVVEGALPIVGSWLFSNVERWLTWYRSAELTALTAETICP
jgi:hypothetical protein